MEVNERSKPTCLEAVRIREEATRERNWGRWGPYLSERQWATVREDYSDDGSCWQYFPHEHARSRAYRWGEDGLLGITDRECRLCFAIALWNGKDPILKERLFGLTGPEGNHGEDVKECYYYLDSTPTHSYMKALYKYPQAEFPYQRLRQESKRRGLRDPEFEILDTGVFDENRYFDVFAEYAKSSPDDILIRVTVANRGEEAAPIHLLPTIWFRNTWDWGGVEEGAWEKPSIELASSNSLVARHQTLGNFVVALETPQGVEEPEILFTENESNAELLFGGDNHSPYVKDAFHAYVVKGRKNAVNPARTGTKAAGHFVVVVPPGSEIQFRMRMVAEAEAPATFFGADFDRTFQARIEEADHFYRERISVGCSADDRKVVRQAYAGLLWSKQFYNYIVKSWLDGDSDQPPPPEARWKGRNHDWQHLYSRDVISMPDKWEYPWFAAWDLAFHMVAFARIDLEFAKKQLILLLREWYMHPNGEMPAYEFNFSDVNPPVHAWACWRVYKMTGPRGKRDTSFLARVFPKLLINFTWWVNRKDLVGNHLFSGGFLGMDNIGVFDRSQPLPNGAYMEESDGTAWMAFYCGTMLHMALELAEENPAYEDIASKFFEHFVAIVDAMNSFGGTGLWDEEDGFYYSNMKVDGRHVPLKVRSMVGLIPLIAVEILDDVKMDKLAGFSKRTRWFLKYRQDLSRNISYLESGGGNGHPLRLLAVPSKERLLRVLKYLLDENEFLSPHGIRSLSRVHKDKPFVFDCDGSVHTVDYEPAESTTGMFGGNSNWRGPVWFPVNYLLIEALERYCYFYGDSVKVEFPTGSGKMMTLSQVARELASRLVGIFRRGENGCFPWRGANPKFAHDLHWKDLTLFYEYFDGDTGRGLGASHQTGWTALVARWIEDLYTGAI